MDTPHRVTEEFPSILTPLRYLSFNGSPKQKGYSLKLRARLEWVASIPLRVASECQLRKHKPLDEPIQRCSSRCRSRGREHASLLVPECRRYCQCAFLQRTTRSIRGHP